MSTITVLLVHWRRPENMSRLLDSLGSQTLRPDIFFWNNGATFLDARLDLVIQSNRNLRCWPRWFMASLAETDYVCAIDDDLALGDDRVLEDLVHAMDEDGVPDRAYGLDGLVIPRGTTYRQAQWPDGGGRRAARVTTAVDVVKGQLLAVHRTALETLPMLHGVMQDDIAICGLLAAGRPQHHRALGEFRGRFEFLPTPHAMCDEPEHFDRRDAAVLKYLHI